MSKCCGGVKEKLDELTELIEDKACENIGARVYATAIQTIPHNTLTPLDFGAENYDTDTIWDISNPTRLTCKTAGKYIIQGQTLYFANPTASRWLEVILNGATAIAIKTIDAIDDAGTAIQISTAYDLQVNDYVELITFQSSGSDRATATINTWFTMNKVSCKNGVDGATGATGTTGATGAQGEPGQDGEDGATGAQGIQGVQGNPGTNGTNGTNGIDSAIMVEDEPPGVNCPNGGTKVTAGQDTNGDGVPDANLTVEYVCDPELGDSIVAKVRKNAPQILEVSGETIITWETVEKDTDSFYSGVNPERLTIPIVGDYQGNILLIFEGVTPGVTVIGLVRDSLGNTVAQDSFVASAIVNVLDLNFTVVDQPIGRYFEVVISGINVGSVSDVTTYFAIHLIK